MARVEILSVSGPDAPPAALRGFAIESPAAGDAREDPFVPLTGWVLGRESRATGIEVLHRGKEIRGARVRRRRADVLAAHPDVGPGVPAGFSAIVGVLGLGVEFALDVQAVLEDGERAPVGTVRGRCEPLPTPSGQRLRALRVSSMRRSGSTWLMQLIGAHPEIVVFPAYPYESAPARYWAYLLKVVAEPFDETKPGRFTDPHHVGHNPYFNEAVAADPRLLSWYAHDHLEDLADLCRRSAEGWYARVAETQDKPRAAVFAEKHILQPGELTETWSELYPGGSEVLLVRDLRDMTYSAIAWDRARGFRRYSDRPGEPYEPYVRHVRRVGVRMRELWNAGDGAHKLRYEDLIARPDETLADLFAHVGVDASPETVAAVVRDAEQPVAGTREHITAPSVEKSVGRWREEADESFRTLCDELLGDLLGAFGYE